MKTKKIFLVSIYTSLFALSGCINMGGPNTRYLQVENLAKDFAQPPKSGHYKVGETVEFTVDLIYDAEIYVFLNEERLDNYKYDNEKGYRYFSFEMPKKDSTLVCTWDSQYYRKEWTLRSLYPSLECMDGLTIDDMVEIRQKTVVSGVNPDIAEPKEIITTDERDFEYNLNALFVEKLEEAEDYVTPDGNAISNFTFVFRKNGEEKEFALSIDDYYYVYAPLRKTHFKYKNGHAGAPKIQYPNETSDV